MINNLMNFPDYLFLFFIINLIGGLLIYFGIFLYNKYRDRKIKKIKASLISSVILLCVSIAIITDIGLYYWIKSGDKNVLIILLSITICALPILLPIFAFGTYIQLGYQDKMREMTTKLAGKDKKSILP